MISPIRITQSIGTHWGRYQTARVAEGPVGTPLAAGNTAGSAFPASRGAIIVGVRVNGEDKTISFCGFLPIEDLLTRTGWDKPLTPEDFYKIQDPAPN
jgi:hypothetical protein